MIADDVLITGNSDPRFYLSLSLSFSPLFPLNKTPSLTPHRLSLFSHSLLSLLEKVFSLFLSLFRLLRFQDLNPVTNDD